MPVDWRRSGLGETQAGQGQGTEGRRPAIAAAGGRFLIADGVVIHHHLQEKSFDEGGDKASRYLELQRLKAAEQPTDAKAQWELGWQYLIHGQLDAAL